MATQPITWSAADSTTAAVNIDSDTVNLEGTVGFSATVIVTGSAPNGIAGNLTVIVSNTNLPGSWVIPPGGIQSVLVNNGQTQAFGWSYETFYEYAQLQWVVGSDTDGTLSDGAWNTTLQILPVASVIPAQPTGVILNQSLQLGVNPNPWGVDINCGVDLDPYFSLVGGTQCLAQDLYHLITSNTGSLFWAPSLCYSCIGLLSQGVTESELGTIQSNMTNALMADERVQMANVGLSYEIDTQVLTASVAVQPLAPQGNAQPFQFIASISAAGNSLFSISSL